VRAGLREPGGGARTAPASRRNGRRARGPSGAGPRSWSASTSGRSTAPSSGSGSHSCEAGAGSAGDAWHVCKRLSERDSNPHGRDLGGCACRRYCEMNNGRSGKHATCPRGCGRVVRARKCAQPPAATADQHRSPSVRPGMHRNIQTYPPQAPLLPLARRAARQGHPRTQIHETNVGWKRPVRPLPAPGF
jgi:hypothetical protein